MCTSAGWYSDRGLDVTFISPHSDGYKTTPAQRLSSGEADVAVTPTETVISSLTQPAHSTKPRLKVRAPTPLTVLSAPTCIASRPGLCVLSHGIVPRKPRRTDGWLVRTQESDSSIRSHALTSKLRPCRLWQAIAAILQDDTSAIVTLKSSGLDRPAKLDGRTYASYGARYEGRIVQRMIKNDGGIGDYKEVALPMLGIWETILKVTALLCSGGLRDRCIAGSVHRFSPSRSHPLSHVVSRGLLPRAHTSMNSDDPLKIACQSLCDACVVPKSLFLVEMQGQADATWIFTGW